MNPATPIVIVAATILPLGCQSYSQPITKQVQQDAIINPATMQQSDLRHMPDTPPLSDSYLNAIKGFEGYSPQATWDYRQHTNGYGTKAAYPGEKIDRDTAEQRFQSEIGKAAQSVDTAFPQLPEGARAALSSLTFNAGPGWIGGGLGNAVRKGDWGTAQNMFRQYNHAGGQVLPGLTARRNQEAAWLVGAQGPQPMGSSPGPGLTAQSLGAQGTPIGAPLFGGMPAPSMQPQNSMAGIGLSMLQGQPLPSPSMQPMQFAPLSRPQIDYSGLQAMLFGQKGFS